MTLNSSPKGNINRTLKHKSSIDFKNWGEEQRMSSDTRNVD